MIKPQRKEFYRYSDARRYQQWLEHYHNGGEIREAYNWAEQATTYTVIPKEEVKNV